MAAATAAVATGVRVLAVVAVVAAAAVVAVGVVAVGAAVAEAVDAVEEAEAVEAVEDAAIYQPACCPGSLMSSLLPSVTRSILQDVGCRIQEFAKPWQGGGRLWQVASRAPVDV